MWSKSEYLDNDGCFVCGSNNPIGMKLQFEMEGDEYVTYYTPAPEHQGFAGVVHGGIVSTVMDEVMARYAFVENYGAVTGEMTVKYRKPMYVGKRYRFAGKIESSAGRKVLTSAKATDEGGNLIAEATAILVRVMKNDD